MALFECGVVYGVLLLAHDIGRVSHNIPAAARRYAQAQIFRHHLRKAARGPVALHAYHGAVAEQRRKAVAVLHCLVCVPMRIYAYMKQLHKKISVARCHMRALHDADV